METADSKQKFQEDALAPMHTCEHIVNRTMINMFGCGRSVSAHIEKKKSKLDYIIEPEPDDTRIAELEAKVNEVIGRNLPVTEEFISIDEAALRFDLNRLPENTSGTVRVIHVGDYDECLCIGRHVQNTSMIGRFTIISKDYENGRLRIRFKLKKDE